MVVAKRRLFNCPAEICEYCLSSKSTEDSDYLLCRRHGAVERTDSCRGFKYDPLKRRPDPIKPLGEFSKEDFML